MNTTQYFGAALLASVLLGMGMAGCTVMREQSTVGQAVDDTAITAKVKARFAESPVVSVMAIKVETFHGTVQLSGSAKSETERSTAESIARQVSNVKSVRNDIIVRP
ncbi:MAG: BON domain-containing protein [Thiobacillus sp.]